MSKVCDLHTHSYYSDGTDSPTQLIGKAVEMGVSAIALTDHDTVAGIPEFMGAAMEAGIRAIPGIEITTVYEGKELHIVGLFLDPKRLDQINDFISIMGQYKEESNQELIKRLNQIGYDLNYEEIRKKHQGNINRAVIAAAMLEKGYISSIKEAFDKLLDEKFGLYVPPKRFTSFEAIAYLKSIAAVPVLAHPFLNLSEEELIGFIPQAKYHGLAAMETRYSTYSPETTAAAERIARDFGLLESGGSDYHGHNKPDIELGIGRGCLIVPEQLEKQLEHYKR